MRKSIFALIVLCISNMLSANVRLQGIFTNHAVLQRNAPINVWGWADKGEKVIITLNKQKQTAIADKVGKWKLQLKAMPAGGPYDFTVKGKNTIILKDIMIGEVWLCSGQSNMVYPLGGWQKGAEEIPTEKCEAIRQIKIKETISAEPAEDIISTGWQTYSSEVATGFSAVAYHFAKSLNEKLDIPVGIINSAWGGTSIEAWISHSALIQLQDYAQVPVLTTPQLSNWFTCIENLHSGIRQKLGIESFANYKVDDTKWCLSDYDDTKWLDVPELGSFDKTILPCFDGTVWFRSTFEMGKTAMGEDFVVHLGVIEDEYELYINGVKINTENSTEKIQEYKIDPKIVNSGKNVISIKVKDYWETGGFTSSIDKYYIERKNGDRILFGKQTWKMNIAEVTRTWVRNPNVHPNLLFNGMINPVTSYSIKGTLWYQGENNENYAYQYRYLLPALIADWRSRFKQGDFPFYFVQLPNYKKMAQNTQNGGANWAEMREAYLKTLNVSNTAMTVTIDLGDSTDIHPPKKKEVGRRLSLIALNNLYGQPNACFGPEVESVTKSNGKIIVTFKKTLNTTLVVRDIYGYLKGFEIAGEDQHFYYSKATVDGNKVILQNDNVLEPVAVRYSWSNNPDGNLYNSAGLPASPFRTDTWKLTTEDNKFDAWIGNRYKQIY